MSRYYDLELWDGAQWLLVPKHSGLGWRMKYNGNDNMNVTIYASTSQFQNLMVSGTPYRVTKKGGGFEVQTGTIGNVDGDGKTSVVNDKPVVYRVSGSSYFEKVAQIEYDIEREYVPTGQTESDPPATQVQVDWVGDVVGAIITQMNTREPVVAGTIDNGFADPKVLFRHDLGINHILDLATIGDATTKFYYRTMADTSSPAFTPSLHFLAPDNSTFVHPNGQVGFEINDPIAAVDPLRIIDVDSEVRNPFNISSDKDRIVNALKMRYRGHGSGREQVELPTFVEDASSIAAYGRREAADYQQWIQGQSTATQAAETKVNMFKDIPYGTAKLKTGEVWSSAFNAVLGDVVSIARGNTSLITGRLLGMEYSQQDESLSVSIGIPRYGNEQFSKTNRNVERSYASSRQVVDDFSTATPPVSGIDGSSTVFVPGPFNIGPNPTTQDEETNTALAPADFTAFPADTAGYVVETAPQITAVGQGAIGGSPPEDVYEGDLRYLITLKTDGGDQYILQGVFDGPNVTDSGSLYQYVTIPFAIGNEGDLVDEIEVRIIGHGMRGVLGYGVNPCQEVQLDFNLTVGWFDRPDIDFSHKHKW